jgi:hypothetical protein
MPQPAASDVYLSVPLTNIAIAFTQDAVDFIADQVFPNIPVTQQSGRYWKYDRQYWYRSEATLRGPSTESGGSGWEVDNTPTYFCDVYAVHKDVDDQVRANAVAPINMDRDASKWVTEQLLLKRELLWQASYFKTGIWTGGSEGAFGLAGVAGGPAAHQFKQWDQAGSTPVEDITAQIDAVDERTGYAPNVLVLSPYVFRRLTNNAEFLDRIKYTQRGIVTAEILAAVLGVDKVLIGRAVQNTSKEGNAVQTTAYVLPKAAFLAYAAPAPSLMEPTAGYTFSWNGYLGAGPAGQRMSSFRMEWLKSDRVEGEISFDCEVVASELGVFFSAAVA